MCAAKRIALIVSCCAALLSCEDGSTQGNQHGQKATSTKLPVELFDVTWTGAAAESAYALSLKYPIQYALPEVRVYDAKQRLIFRQKGAAPAEMDSIARAIAGARPIGGPGFQETMAGLQARDGRPAEALIGPHRVVTVVDYWAEWCIPCKLLEKRLLAWAQRQPSGSIALVRAETDLSKFAKSRGDKVYKIVKGPNGTLKKVEM